MKVALVVPPKQKLAQDQFHRTPQMGIGYIAGGLKREGVEFTVYNSKHAGIYEDELTRLLINGDYDLVGFSSMTFEIKSVGRIAKNIKKAKKNCRIVVGGCHTNALPKESMEEFPDFDLICIGEHEDQIASIFKLLYTRDYGELEKFDHIIFRKNGGLFYRNLTRRFIKDVDSVFWPAYELFASKDLTPAYFSARGCPYFCSFCQQNSGRVIRRRSPQAVCDEIEHFSDYFKQDTFTFRDESFTVDKKHTASICNELIKRGLNKKLKWTCETHSRAADYDLFRLMKEAGCYYVDIGGESGSNEILKATGKSTTVEAIIDACRKVRKAKLKLGGLFILGHPNETKRTMLKTIALGTKLNPDSITFSMMTPFPGTKVYEYALRNEAGLKLLTKDWERYDNITGSAMAWDAFSLKTIKIFQLVGLVLYHIYNLRLVQFTKYLHRHKKGIISYFLAFFGIRYKEF
ncbi:MAG: radical SAM protein [Candidatus Omnitrophica bacterium]|nr:radical SAM protein [Candidatus Omnitrophota bacterium]